MPRKTVRQVELEQVDKARERLRAASDNPHDPKHEEAQRLGYKLATDFSVPARTLLECSSFWVD